MNYFLAVNDRQLGTCLRMLFAEKLQPAVQTVLNEKGKIEFHISIAADHCFTCVSWLTLRSKVGLFWSINGTDGFGDERNKSVHT